MLTLQFLPQALTVCKLDSLDGFDTSGGLYFIGRTDEELSLVCETARAPRATLARRDGWRAFRIAGTLDFSLTGILAPIATLLARAGIGIFAVSTYNTDYVLLNDQDLRRAAEVLEGAGYAVNFPA
ncbi:MAG: ACT domain-containing protein [Clostridia bacterium]|nr:ACT domain-containing protein [Clostridia bacterium]